MKRFVESNIPDDLYAQVRYITQLRNPEHSERWDTYCYLKERETNRTVATGVAKCSDHDNPNRKIGRAIAVGRALKQLHQSHEHRA